MFIVQPSDDKSNQDKLIYVLEHENMKVIRFNSKDSQSSNEPFYTQRLRDLHSNLCVNRQERLKGGSI